MIGIAVIPASIEAAPRALAAADLRLLGGTLLLSSP
jgi:hypothetical protein